MTIAGSARGKLRIGVAGAGFWARDIHLPVLGAHPEVELVGLWNRSPERAREVAATFGIAAFDDFDAMLEAVDAVSFVVAPDAQAGLALRTARRGRHLLLEKPLALTVPEGEAVAAAIDAARLAAVVFFTRRFEPEVARAIAAAAAERSWASATARFHSGSMRPGTPYVDSAWRQRYGALWDVGPHSLSLLLPVMGEVAEVAASREDGGRVRLRLDHAGGGTTELSLSLWAEPADQGESYLFRAGSAERLVTVLPAGRQPAFRHAVDALVGAVRTGAGHACDAGFALQVLRILVAAEASLRDNRSVRVSEGNPS